VRDTFSRYPFSYCTRKRKSFKRFCIKMELAYGSTGVIHYGFDAQEQKMCREQAHLGEVFLDCVFAAWVEKAMLLTELAYLRSARRPVHSTRKTFSSGCRRPSRARDTARAGCGIPPKRL